MEGKEIYNYQLKSIDGKDISLKNFEGKALLIVNTASKCGFTNQYQGLESLYKKYSKDGLVVLGVPCNQFNSQEPGSEADIKSFCELNFGVTFPLFSKVDVNGDDAHPLFNYLKSSLPGFLGSKAIKWNFTKFLVDKNGNPVKRFAPKDTPESLEEDIKKVL